jgi:hydrogenase maturation protease
MRTRLLVIGYGSELRRDDAVGPRTARAVAAWQLPGVAAIATHQLMPELAEPIAEAERVVFVDAGQNETLHIRPIEPNPGASWSRHAGSPQELLALAESLCRRRPESWLITLPAPDLGFGEGLSAAAERGIAEALRQIRIMFASVESMAEEQDR